MKKLGDFVIIALLFALFVAPFNVMAWGIDRDRTAVRPRPSPSQSVPEPSSLMLLASGGGLIYLLRRYFKNRN